MHPEKGAMSTDVSKASSASVTSGRTRVTRAGEWCSVTHATITSRPQNLQQVCSDHAQLHGNQMRLQTVRKVRTDRGHAQDRSNCKPRNDEL